MTSSAPPPGGSPPGSGGAPPNAPATGREPLVVELAAPGGLKRLRGGKGPHRLTLTPEEIVVEHAGALRSPLRFAPGSVVVATLDDGPASVGKQARGRFPILRRLSPTQVIPREMGIEGWLWTSSDGTAFTWLGDEAPNVAFLFSPPLTGELVESAFEQHTLAELAKRSPLGQPAVFGLLLRVADTTKVRTELERYQLVRELTDREVPPVQRRHLPDDKPANPNVDPGDLGRAEKSVPPPGMG